jgi:rubrerythrin
LDVDRRRFLTVAAVGGSSAWLAACGGSSSSSKETTSPEAGSADVADVAVLNNALDLEHQAVAAYTAGLKVLTGPNLKAAREFRDQERAHAASLAAAIKELGGKPNGPGTYTFPRLRTQREFLRFASFLENTAIAAYIDALPRLNNGDTRAAGASILANEAEHLAVLNSALGLRTAPAAFVTGQAQSA